MCVTRRQGVKDCISSCRMDFHVNSYHLLNAMVCVRIMRYTNLWIVCIQMYVIVFQWMCAVFSGVICHYYPGLVSIGRNKQFTSQSIPSIEFLPLCQVPENPSRNKANEGASEARDCLLWKRFPIICGNSCLSNGFARCSKQLSIIITHRSVNCFQLSTCGDEFSR